MALIIRDNVSNRRMPKSNDLRLLVSHMRVTHNRQYRRLLEEKIKEIQAMHIAA